ncbi:N-methyl-L-tryptophan oxidase [Terribacillus saccharophilus]|uniref:N-methyl-L-tryptophan oxidase n=1 Tax=Terribacillus saccharophilus TaxID=361277 RepID=UPI0039823A75
MTNENEFEVAIIGAGTMGMAAGAYLAQQNVKTVLIDRFDPPHHSGSHHGTTRMIRHAYGEGRQYVTLVKRAQQLWEELEKQSDHRIFEKTGVLGLGPSTSTFLEETRKSAEKYDLPLEVLSAQQIKDKWPGISIPDDYIGCFETDSGLIYSENAIQAYRGIALEHGAQLITDTAVQQIDITDKKHIKIVMPNQVISAQKAIVTAGAWAAKLLPDLKLPIQPYRKVVGWFEAPETLYHAANFPSFYIEDNEKMFYGFPDLNGEGLKLGRTDGGQKIDPDQHTQNFGAYEEDEQELRDLLQTYMPKADGLLKQSSTCLLTHSPDHDFIIDHHPENENVVIACGFSGHGFKFGSVMGEVLSQLAVDGESEYDLSLFALKRFGL